MAPFCQTFTHRVIHASCSRTISPLTCTGADVTQAMSAKYANGKFYLPGMGLLWGNGVAVSDDNGSTFRGINISVLERDCFPRWSAHPTPDVWYVAAGEQPQNGNPPTGGNYAQLVKTEDAGKTWTSQLYSQGKFYFMDIDCSDEKTCWWVLLCVFCALPRASLSSLLDRGFSRVARSVCSEADQDSPTLGIAIYCTFDGSSWK